MWRRLRDGGRLPREPREERSVCCVTPTAFQDVLSMLIYLYFNLLLVRIGLRFFLHCLFYCISFFLLKKKRILETMLGSAAQIMRRHNRVVANRFGGVFTQCIFTFFPPSLALAFPQSFKFPEGHSDAAQILKNQTFWGGGGWGWYSMLFLMCSNHLCSS